MDNQINTEIVRIQKKNGMVIESDKSTIREAVVENKNSLFGANLADTQLYYADLHCANLYEANLENCKLLGANLERANLRKTNLNNADLRHVDSRWLNIDEDAEILFRMDCCAWPVTIFHKKVMVGCKDFTFDEILSMTDVKADAIFVGAGKRWNRFGNTLKMAINDIISSGL